MTLPVVEMDWAHSALTELMRVVRFIYDPNSPYPPLGGGTTRVQFVSGEGPEWNPLAGRIGDEQDNETEINPFLWVRLITRYRSTAFPEPTNGTGCAGTEVVVFEVGVGRCVNIDPVPDWNVIAEEADWGLDDSWRLSKIGCALAGQLRNTHLVAYDPATPEGPEGGGIVWSTTVYIGELTEGD